MQTLVARSSLVVAALVAFAAGCGDDVTIEDGSGGAGGGATGTTTGAPTSGSTSTTSGASNASSSASSSSASSSTGSPFCNAGDRRCSDDGDVEECSEDGGGFVVVETCDAGLACSDGACVDACAAAAEAMTHVGCVFWAADLDQQDGGGNDPASEPWAVLITAVGDQAADITIEVDEAEPGDPPDLVTVAAVTIQPGASEEVVLEARELDCGTQPNDYASPGTCLSSRALRVTSSSPIVVAQLNALIGAYSNDASLLFPEAALGTTYRVLGWQAGHPIDLGFPGAGVDRSYVTIIGTEEDTEVTFESSWRVKGNDPIDAIEAGGSTTVTLQPFGVLNLETDDGTDEDDVATIADLSGSLVVADKPVAVFTGTESAAAPGGAVDDVPTFPGWDDDTCCLDHLEEQLAPITAAGRDYVVTRSPLRSDDWREADLIRFVGGIAPANVETTLPPPWSTFTLAPGEVKTTWAQDNFVATADAQFLVGQVLASQGYTTRLIGDPSLLIVTPAAQFLADQVVSIPSGWTESWIVIAAPLNMDVTIDDELPAGCVVDDAGEVLGQFHESRTCQVSAGPHHLRAEGPFGVTVYGYAAAASYAFAGGTGLVSLEEP